jgi:hypothetical protein
MRLFAMNGKVDDDEKKLSEVEGNKRLNDKFKELKKRNITPPVDNDEPTGLLSGGPDHLDLDDSNDAT